MHATYCVEDNYFRLYPVEKLDPELRQRLKGHGFAWHTYEKVYVARKWTPEREDFLKELCGVVEEDQYGVVERYNNLIAIFNNHKEQRLRDAEHYEQEAKAIMKTFKLKNPMHTECANKFRMSHEFGPATNKMKQRKKMLETATYWGERVNIIGEHIDNFYDLKRRKKRLTMLKWRYKKALKKFNDCEDKEEQADLNRWIKHFDLRISYAEQFILDLEKK